MFRPIRNHQSIDTNSIYIISAFAHFPSVILHSYHSGGSHKTPTPTRTPHLDTPHRAPNTPHPTPHTPHPTPQTTHTALRTHTPHCAPHTPYPVPRTPDPAPRTPHPAPRAPHRTPYPHHTPHTPHCARNTPHPAIRTPHPHSHRASHTVLHTRTTHHAPTPHFTLNHPQLSPYGSAHHISPIRVWRRTLNCMVYSYQCLQRWYNDSSYVSN